MEFFAYSIIGLVVGVIVRVALPPAPQVGFVGSVLLGLVGGLAGGLFGSMLAPGSVASRIHPLGVTLALILSAAVTIGVTLATRRRRFG
jgi:uncharacterized membrane protein YeaQ/YmgE (transglycosylase-associated protein family)